jgi:cell division protein FtsQ
MIIGIPVLLLIFTFSIKKAAVVGASHYTDQQIREMVLKSGADNNSLYLFLKYKFLKTPQIPFIEKIDVEMIDNHKVSINVYEKTVIGCVKYMGEYLYFDKDGIIVESSSDKSDDIPIIYGLEFNRIILHQKLKVQKDELYDVILNMTKLIRKYKVNVDKICFDTDYNVTLECGKITVLLGKKSYYDDALSDLKNILIKAAGTKVRVLDMSNYTKGTGYVIGRTEKSTE